MCFFSSRKTLAELASLAISVKRGGMKVLVVLDGGVGDGLVVLAFLEGIGGGAVSDFWL